MLICSMAFQLFWQLNCIDSDMHVYQMWYLLQFKYDFNPIIAWLDSDRRRNDCSDKLNLSGRHFWRDHENTNGGIEYT